MQIFFVISLLFAILVSVFAVMNSEPVTVKLLWKQYEFSQALVILGSAFFGAIIVAFLGIFSKIKSSLKVRELNSKIRNLEKHIEELEKNGEKNIRIEHTTVKENIVEQINDEEQKGSSYAEEMDKD